MATLHAMFKCYIYIYNVSIYQCPQMSSESIIYPVLYLSTVFEEITSSGRELKSSTIL